jgi:hypothetical protein
MLKKEMEQKIEEYKEILYDIGKWAFPQQYEINKNKAMFHIEGIRKVLKERFYLTKDA